MRIQHRDQRAQDADIDDYLGCHRLQSVVYLLAKRVCDDKLFDDGKLRPGWLLLWNRLELWHPLSQLRRLLV